MKIYTRTGDEGGTGLYDGTRVSKCNAVIEALGALDELSCDIGCAVAFLPNDFAIAELADTLKEFQMYLLDMGSLLAYPRAPTKKGLAVDTDGVQVVKLETSIDEMTAQLPSLTNFILPGGIQTAAHLHKARASCRRAERRIVKLRETDEVQNDESVKICLVFLNRFSDYLFTLARFVNNTESVNDIVYKQSRGLKI